MTYHRTYYQSILRIHRYKANEFQKGNLVNVVLQNCDKNLWNLWAPEQTTTVLMGPGTRFWYTPEQLTTTRNAPHFPLTFNKHVVCILTGRSVYHRERIKIQRVFTLLLTQNCTSMASVSKALCHFRSAQMYSVNEETIAGQNDRKVLSKWAGWLNWHTAVTTSMARFTMLTCLNKHLSSYMNCSKD